MDAADAAALFSQMDPGFAAGFLGRMQADAAAGVMAELDPGVAYTISVLIATRNASAPVSASAAPGTP
jgi:flagellar motility protein MotE (MotC chaperone)